MSKQTKPRNPFACAVIDALGGNQTVAAMFEIHHASVSEWRAEGIPKPRLQYLRLSNPEVFRRRDVRKAANQQQ